MSLNDNDSADDELPFSEREFVLLFSELELLFSFCCVSINR
jgi:hypothetical protein